MILRYMYIYNRVKEGFYLFDKWKAYYSEENRGLILPLKQKARANAQSKYI